jgi:cytochrome P450
MTAAVPDTGAGLVSSVSARAATQSRDISGRAATSAHGATHSRDVSAIPGPKGNPLVGSASDFRKRMLRTFLRGMYEYGDTVAYDVGPRGTPLRIRIVIAHHPDDAQRILSQTEKSITKQTVAFTVVSDVLGNGLLTSSGEDWKRQRRIVQPLFTPRRVAGYTDLMAEEATRIAREPIPIGPVDLHLLMLRYTLRVVGRTLFGDDIEDTVPVLDDLVPKLSDVIRTRMMRPWTPSLDRRLPGNFRPRRLKARQYEVIDKIIRRSPAPGDPRYDPDRDDLVTRLRQAVDPDTGEGIGEAELRDQALIFLLAGHETTAGALTFTLHLLGRHQEVQDQLAAEVRQIADDGPLTYDQVQPLTFTRACLQEGIRLFPSAYATERATTGPFALRDYDLPPDQLVVVSPWTTHRHPEFWPDPERYDPTRFLGPSNRPRYAYFPFGGGPRSCVGEQFAMLEAVTLLATFLRNRRVVSESADLPVVPRVTLRPVGPVFVRFAAR